MTFDPAKALVSYHAALDGQDLKAVAAYLAPDARYVSVGLGDVTGRDAILAAMAKYFEASCRRKQVAAAGHQQDYW
jgi:ketosteroid isomerase-like protein